MEKINENGDRQEVSPSEVAKIDQMEALFQDQLSALLMQRRQIKEAAINGDNDLLAELTKGIDALVREQLPQAGVDGINFIMFLVHLLEQAQAWTQYNFDAMEALIVQVGALVRPDHPLHSIPGFDLDSCNRSLIAVLDLPSDQEQDEEHCFTTDTGIVLGRVHARETCQGSFCVVHRPVPGPWDTWDTHWREDWQLMARICVHDVHHVAMEEMLRTPVLGMIAHEHPAGCDCACDFGRVETLTDAEGAITGFRAKE